MGMFGKSFELVVLRERPLASFSEAEDFGEAEGVKKEQCGLKIKKLKRYQVSLTGDLARKSFHNGILLSLGS
jgi:hypothetical protein